MLRSLSMYRFRRSEGGISISSSRITGIVSVLLVDVDGNVDVGIWVMGCEVGDNRV
jgi:hypothetical protein